MPCIFICLKSGYLTFTVSGLQSHHCEGSQKNSRQSFSRLSGLLLLLLSLHQPFHPKRKLLLLCGHHAKPLLISSPRPRIKEEAKKAHCHHHKLANTKSFAFQETSTQPTGILDTTVARPNPNFCSYVHLSFFFLWVVGRLAAFPKIFCSGVFFFLFCFVLWSE